MARWWSWLRRQGRRTVREQRGGIDSYVVKGVLIFIAVAGAWFAIKYSNDIWGRVGNMVGRFTQCTEQTALTDPACQPPGS